MHGPRARRTLRRRPIPRAARAKRPRRRLAVTSLEYLVMISSILVVLILVIGYLGGLTRGSVSTSSDTINKATGGGP